MSQPCKKNLDPHIKENHFPHLQLEAQDTILNHQKARLEIKLNKGKKQKAQPSDLPGECLDD